MWPITFEERLQEWHALRVSAAALPDQERCLNINDWWFRAPMVNRNLRWENYPEWPDPWKLLDENRWCSLARALGIVYTLMMIDDSYRYRLKLDYNNGDNLVRVDDGKYILNWCPGDILNTHSQHFPASQQLDCDPLYFLIE